MNFISYTDHRKDEIYLVFYICPLLPILRSICFVFCGGGLLFFITVGNTKTIGSDKALPETELAQNILCEI